ncbi:transcription factor SPT20 homolog [Anastrepha ludens]|uniref:transcription factor SPT20 homolog n=1 Tax=Anastrepha ludens TaxID=28586 RepID=UPI0023AFDB03|nr:transcription factor SPT20 homolog [Anastrepha ludens]
MIGKMFNLRVALLFFGCFSTAFTENVANISDSLAVETTVDSIKVSTSLPPEVKSKTEKRDSSDQIGPTIFTLKEDEPFKPITSATYHQQLPLQPQQFQSSSAPSTFQPTTVRYVAEEAAPQVYYDRPPNGAAPAITNAEKLANLVDGGIHYGTPTHAYRGPFKGPYQLQFEQTHPQPQTQQQQQQPFNTAINKQRYNQQQYAQVPKLPPSPGYASPPSTDVSFLSLGGLPQQQQQSPHQQRHYHPQSQQEQQNEQQKLQQQQQAQKYVPQQQQPFVALQKQSHPQQQQQQSLQYQQPARQQIHYIIAIPLSYVRQLQHQLAAQHGSPPTNQHQHQLAAPIPLQTPRHSPLPPLIVLQPVGSSGGGGSSISSSNSLSREPYRLQPPIHYVPQASAPSNPEAGSHIQSPPALVPQQLPAPLNLVLAAAAVRPRHMVYPASQLLFVQPQLIRHAPQQQLQLQVKQHQQPPHYAQAPDQQQQHSIEERNAQQPHHQQQPQPQQHEQRPKSTVKQALVPPPSAATVPSSTSSLPPLSLPPPAASPHAPTALPLHSSLPAAPPVFFYNPAYVQSPPPEQHPLPPSHYSSYIQGQFGPAQHPATLVKLSAPSALLAPQTALTPHFYPIHHSLGGPPALATVLSPQSLLVAKAPLQFQQPSHQQPPALPAFVSKPAVYMAPQDVVNGIAVSGSGGGLPYFIHPAGVHYGTHLHNPDTPLVATSKILGSAANAVADNQQHHLHLHQQSRPEQQRKQQQQQLDSRAASGGNDDNNAIVKYP